MVVDGRCAPVGLVGQGSDVLIVVFSELKADSGQEAAQEQHGGSSLGWTSSSISERSSEGRRSPRGSEEKSFSAFWKAVSW